MDEAHQYRDQFLSADEFQWQSQNSTRQTSKRGLLFSAHKERGVSVRLFVRPTAKLDGKAAPFYYCGVLEFERWEGEKPITIWWHMKESLPEHLHERMGI